MKLKFKGLKWVVIACVGIPLIAVCAMFIYGESEPNITVSGTGIQIQTMYGLDIEFENIDSIELIGQSMSGIRGNYEGRRTNG